MVALISYIFQGIFFLVVVYFGLYILLEIRTLLISNRVERRKLVEVDQSSAIYQGSITAKVTVLLPICNEASVVERLIDGVCCLQYPKELFEILVLDDSSDYTSALASARVDSYAAKGINIRLIRRQNRSSYKAGNLANGIKQASGDFYAIFDADFVPPADFLTQTIPHFDDPEIGYLQTGIGYENRDVSFLTKFQAMEMGHQQYVTVGLSADGNMASLSGSSCVWRKSCVEELGGWNSTTITEDVDLGYRAQFGDWKYVYLRDVVSMSVLPERVSAYRIQRERWGRGLIHSGLKHLGEMMKKRMPLMKRLHAFSMMFSSMLLASIYVLILLTLPLSFSIDCGNLFISLTAITFFTLATVWGLYNVYGAYKGARFDKTPNISQATWCAYLYMAMFLPMSWYYFAGGLRAIRGVNGGFHRTPKGKDEYRKTLPRINSNLLLGEIFTFFYSLIALIVGVLAKTYILIPFNVTICLGFGLIIFWDWTERRTHVLT